MYHQRTWLNHVLTIFSQSNHSYTKEMRKYEIWPGLYLRVEELWETGFPSIIHPNSTTIKTTSNRCLLLHQLTDLQFYLWYFETYCNYSKNAYRKNLRKYANTHEKEENKEKSVGKRIWKEQAHKRYIGIVAFVQFIYIENIYTLPHATNEVHWPHSRQASYIQYHNIT